MMMVRLRSKWSTKKQRKIEKYIKRFSDFSKVWKNRQKNSGTPISHLNLHKKLNSLFLLNNQKRKSIQSKNQNHKKKTIRASLLAKPYKQDNRNIRNLPKVSLLFASKLNV